MNARPWIQSYTGRKVTPFDLQPDQVCLEDVAHALGNKCRFSGHSIHHYSVAQHSVLGARLMPPAFAMAFLLHDVSETYLPDIASPLKSRVKWCDDAGNSIQQWEALEAQHARVILEALGQLSILPLLQSPEVRAMDLAMLVAEKNQILEDEPESWGITAEPAPVTIYQRTPAEAAQEFLTLFQIFAGKVQT